MGDTRTSGIAKRDENGNPLISWVDKGNGEVETKYHDTGKVSVTQEFDDGSILLKEGPNDRADSGFLEKVTGRSRDR